MIILVQTVPLANPPVFADWKPFVGLVLGLHFLFAGPQKTPNGENAEK